MKRQILTKSVMSVTIIVALGIFLTGCAGGKKGNPTLPAQPAQGTTYYVSATEGNDGNNGTSKATPWKTLGKVSSVEFKPGDVILLKRGDVWAESLLPKGSGSSTNWITLSAYGSGNRPKIAPQGNPLWGIYLENCAGWKITGLEVSNAQAGIRLLISAPGNYDGFWVEDCYVHDIENAPLSLDEVEPGLYMSYGISTFKVLNMGLPPLTNVTVKNCVIKNTDAPVTIASVDNLTIEGLNIDHSYREGVLLSQINGGSMRDCVILNTGYPKGMYWGVAGMQFNSTKDFVMENCEVAYTQAPDCPDGCGVDYEGSNVNVTVKNSYIHHNQGPAFLVYKNPNWGSENINTSIINCRIEYNGLKDVSNEPSFLKHKFNLENGGTIAGNRIVKYQGQPLNLVDSLTPQLTEEMPPSYQVSDNVVTDFVIDGPDEYYAKAWEFDADGNVEGFGGNKSTLTSVGGSLVQTVPADNSNSFLVTPDNLDINSSTYKYIKIRVKNNFSAAGILAVQWITTTDTSWDTTWSSGIKSYLVSANRVTNDGLFHDYVINLSSKANWTGTISRLRIKLTPDTAPENNSVEVDYIRVSNTP